MNQDDTNTCLQALPVRKCQHTFTLEGLQEEEKTIQLQPQATGFRP